MKGDLGGGDFVMEQGTSSKRLDLDMDRKNVYKITLYKLGKVH